jgi:hypothetical protein
MQTLASQRASGILKIDGDPAGAVYFSQGEITFAQASWTPGLGVRLLRGLALPEESLDLLTLADRPDRDVGGALLLRRYLSHAELCSALRSAVVDAVTVLTVPIEAGSFVSDLRLAVPDMHWAGSYTRLCAADVWRQVRGWAARMAQHQVARTAPVELCDLGAPSAILRAEQWAVVCAITGAMSAQDIAWRCGLGLCEVIEQVGILLDGGLCALAPGPAAAWPAPSGGEQERWYGGTADLEDGLPHRPQGGGPAPLRPVMSARVTAADAAPPDSGAYAPSPPDLLRRVLDGLKNIG